MERRSALTLSIAVMIGVVWFLSLTMTIGTPPVLPLIWINPEQTAFMRRDPSPVVHQQWVNLSEISPALKAAVIAHEDQAFYQHPGYDLRAMEDAAEYNWRKRKFARGASTITMQVARNLYLSPQKSIFRKVHELLIALKLERLLSKDRILEIYLNIAEWGQGIYGAEAAAQHYFRKDAHDLTPAEASLLASILPRPKSYDRRRFGDHGASAAGCGLQLPLESTRPSKKHRP